MALIECPDCGREVSDSAAACPDCGYPVAKGSTPVPSRAVPEPTERAWWPAVSIIGRIAVGGILLLLARVEQELGAGTGLVGLLVAGSAIPTWYRHKMERLRAAWPSTLVDGLEDRMAQMEQRHLEQMTDLEERIEFAERLITKQRAQIGPS